MCITRFSSKGSVEVDKPARSTRFFGWRTFEAALLGCVSDEGSALVCEVRSIKAHISFHERVGDVGRGASDILIGSPMVQSDAFGRPQCHLLMQSQNVWDVLSPGAKCHLERPSNTFQNFHAFSSFHSSTPGKSPISGQEAIKSTPAGSERSTFCMMTLPLESFT